MSNVPITASGSWILYQLKQQQTQNQLDRIKDLIHDKREPDERR